MNKINRLILAAALLGSAGAVTPASAAPSSMLITIAAVQSVHLAVFRANEKSDSVLTKLEADDRDATLPFKLMDCARHGNRMVC